MRRIPSTSYRDLKVKYFAAAFIIAIAIFFLSRLHDYYLVYYGMPRIMDTEYYLNESIFYKKLAIDRLMLGESKKPASCDETITIERQEPEIIVELVFQERTIHPVQGHWIEIINYEACEEIWQHRVEFEAHQDGHLPTVTIHE